MPPGLFVGGYVPLLAGGVAAVVVLLVLLTLDYTYAFSDGYLVIRRRAFGRVPAGVIKIRTSHIKGAMRSGLVRGVPPGVLPYGRLLALEGIVLLLAPSRHLIFDRAYVTPRDVGGFLSELQSEAAIAPVPPPRKERVVLALAPRWLADALAVLDALGILLLVVDLSRPMDAIQAWPPYGVHVVALGLAVAPVLLMTLLMWLDALRSLHAERAVRYAYWLAGISFAFPAALLYYALEWRPRHGRASAARG